MDLIDHIIPIVHNKLVCQKYSKPCLKQPLSKRPKLGFRDQLLLNAGGKYCRMLLQVKSKCRILQKEHSAILSTFIKLPFVIKIFILSIFECPLKTGFADKINMCCLGEKGVLYMHLM